MTIEATLERIAVALEKIAATPAVPTVTQTAPAPAPVVEPTPTPVVPAAPQAVTPPTPLVAAPTAGASEPMVAPVTPVIPSDCPITDSGKLMEFVMDSYKKMGPAKGNRIQEVLNSIGLKAMNEAQPQHFAAIYAGIEKLKAE